MNFKKTIKLLHLWIGLITGLVVLTVALTGSIYVFAYDIKDFLDEGKHKIESTAPSPRSVSTLFKEASEAVPENIPCVRIYIPRDSLKPYHFVYEKTDRTAWTYSSYKEFHKTVLINPYTAKVLEVENTKWEFFNVVMWTHMCLLLGYGPGSTIVTYSVYLFIFMLISGLFLWWPRKRKKRQYFWFKWKSHTKWRRKNYDLHRIIGFYVLPFAFISACTGLFWSSPTFQNATKWIANGGETIEASFFPTSDSTNSTAPEVFGVITTKTFKLFPEAKYVLIKMARNATAPVIVRANSGDREFERHELYFDQYSGEFLYNQSFDDKNNGDKLAAINYDIHVGNIWGMPTKIMAFLASLAVGMLPVTGFLIWRERRKKRGN